MDIPLDRLTVSNTRSGGPGGQNVNKVATKVEVRFVVAEADWIPERARGRLLELYPSRINHRGELVITSSRHRTRARNLDDCLGKLRDMIAAASARRRRRVPTKPTGASRARRLDRKRRRGEIKRQRGRLRDGE